MLLASIESFLVRNFWCNSIVRENILKIYTINQKIRQKCELCQIKEVIFGEIHS